MRVITASDGAYYSDDYEQQYIEAMGAAGILFVAAAGNGERTPPACLGACPSRALRCAARGATLPPHPARTPCHRCLSACHSGCAADGVNNDQRAPEVRANPASYPLDNIISGKPLRDVSMWPPKTRGGLGRLPAMLRALLPLEALPC